MLYLFNQQEFNLNGLNLIEFINTIVKQVNNFILYLLQDKMLNIYYYLLIEMLLALVSF
jgi:hypothetical protein